MAKTTAALQRTKVPFPGPTWQLITICDSSSRRSENSWPLQTQGTYVVHRYTCGKKTLTYIYISKFKDGFSLTLKIIFKKYSLLSLAIRKYGRDFQAISDVIGNKSVVQVKNFFVNYRRRFNIDEVLQEWEAEHGKDETNGPSNQKPVKSPDSSVKIPEEEDEVSLKGVVSLQTVVRAAEISYITQQLLAINTVLCVPTQVAHYCGLQIP